MALCIRKKQGEEQCLVIRNTVRFFAMLGFRMICSRGFMIAFIKIKKSFICNLFLKVKFCGMRLILGVQRAPEITISSLPLKEEFCKVLLSSGANSQSQCQGFPSQLMNLEQLNDIWEMNIRLAVGVC